MLMSEITMPLQDFKANRNTNAKKVNHECLRDDRPSHGRDVRAPMDGFTACRRVNVMVCNGLMKLE